MDNQDINVFAETNYRNSNRRFGIMTNDRRRHMYLIGKTGMGKSTILENMIVEDIWAGRGVAVVDPHGDLVEKIIEYIPNNRVNDVVYFNPADFDHPIAFNVVEQVEPHLRHLVASGLVSVFQKLWADSWGPRLEYILRNTILAILDFPGSTLLAVTRMLADKKFRKRVIDKIQDPVVKSFWVNEFAGYADKFASEAVSPIQNKVGQFLSTSLIRNIVGQVKSTVDMREIMDQGKILILNLSKGRIGEDSSQLLGAMMITKIQLAAMSRVDIPKEERKDFYLYIDEFQNFTTDSFANILSEARKYRLNLTLAHQYIEQLGDTVKNAVFGNVGTMALFRVGAADAEELEPEFAPTFTQEDIVNLPKYEIYIKLMINGIASDPFSARGLPPLSETEKTGNMEKMIAISRERYAKERSVVEDKITRWHQNDGDENSKPKNNLGPLRKPGRTSAPVKTAAPITITKPAAPAIRPAPDDVYRYDSVCSRCGTGTKTSFKPDGVRPIYCKDCLSIVKQEKKNDFENRRLEKREELNKLDEKIKLSGSIKKINNVAPLKANKPKIIQTQLKEDAISLRDALRKEPVRFSNTKSKTDSDSKNEENIISEDQTVNIL
ncbi:type IV secretion system DNA-binding domain-containing protein [Candidatus Parcubacteria bacterium]|nr:type IV secretion system DNA-binding domain-containing protein [Candidatus Parcubacteria bacterium]